MYSGDALRTRKSASSRAAPGSVHQSIVSSSGHFDWVMEPPPWFGVRCSVAGWLEEIRREFPLPTLLLHHRTPNTEHPPRTTSMAGPEYLVDRDGAGLPL